MFSRLFVETVLNVMQQKNAGLITKIRPAFACGSALGKLRVALGHFEGRDAPTLLLRFRHADGAEGALVAHDVLLQGGEQALGMLGSQNDAALHLRLGYAGQHPGKVDDEIAAGMGDNSEVGIFTLCHVLWQFELQLSWLRIVLFVVHNSSFTESRCNTGLQRLFT